MTTSPHEQIRAAVLSLTDRWDVVLSILEVDRQHAALRLLDGVPPGPWSPCSSAAKAALEVERQVGMPGLAELVARHEALRMRGCQRRCKSVE